MSRWSNPLVTAPTSFRVRVGTEELGLSSGVTLIGRDASCRISIFDPLISRRHARIHCDGAQATIEDLGSRNGTRVNGVAISGPHALRDGDRVTVGTHELVVSVADPATPDWGDIPTGVLNLCPACRIPYPAGATGCPGCGSKDVLPPHLSPPRSEDTVRGRWSLGMLVEMLGKAMLTSRVAEAEKLMRETAFLVGDHLESGSPLDPEVLRILIEAARWLDKAQANDVWSNWLASIDARVKALDSQLLS